MTKRRNSQRYDISLPVIIRVPFKREAPSQIGKIYEIPTQGVHLTIDNDLSAGTELDLTMTLPIEVTRGAEVLIRAIGKVVRVDKRSTDSDQPVGVVAAINQWEIVPTKPPSRGDAPRAESNQFPARGCSFSTLSIRSA